MLKIIRVLYSSIFILIFGCKQITPIKIEATKSKNIFTITDGYHLYLLNYNAISDSLELLFRDYYDGVSYGIYFGEEQKIFTGYSVYGKTRKFGIRIYHLNIGKVNEIKITPQDAPDVFAVRYANGVLFDSRHLKHQTIDPSMGYFDRDEISGKLDEQLFRENPKEYINTNHQQVYREVFYLDMKDDQIKKTYPLKYYGNIPSIIGDTLYGTLGEQSVAKINLKTGGRTKMVNYEDYPYPNKPPEVGTLKDVTGRKYPGFEIMVKGELFLVSHPYPYFYGDDLKVYSGDYESRMVYWYDENKDVFTEAFKLSEDAGLIVSDNKNIYVFGHISGKVWRYDVQKKELNHIYTYPIKQGYVMTNITYTDDYWIALFAKSDELKYKQTKMAVMVLDKKLEGTTAFFTEFSSLGIPRMYQSLIDISTQNSFSFGRERLYLD